MDIRRNDGGKKIINVISDIADLTISGDYLITSLGDVLSREAEIINEAITKKLNPIFDQDSINNSDSETLVLNNYSSVKDFSLEYLVDFKQSMNIKSW
ncbi:MAG: hypothetical protein MZV64_39680 [Ignavibacteriales bacterium]|nr:hypothetical protein [Ignavibacteriales bacterium]